MKEFYCVKCGKVVEAEKESVIIKNDEDYETYFCPHCETEFIETEDYDREYEIQKDNEVFNE